MEEMAAVGPGGPRLGPAGRGTEVGGGDGGGPMGSGHVAAEQRWRSPIGRGDVATRRRTCPARSDVSGAARREEGLGFVRKMDVGDVFIGTRS